MWVEVTTVAELQKTRKLPVEVGGRQLGLFWHDGRAFAFDNVCMHKQRELTGGVILNGRIVCPGHQWAYELESGWCRERERTQPTYPVRIEGEQVLVDVEAVVDTPVQVEAG